MPAHFGGRPAIQGHGAFSAPLFLPARPTRESRCAELGGRACCAARPLDCHHTPRKISGRRPC
eukprot:7044159-Lingulodinium_polyedra.AAC.1